MASPSLPRVPRVVPLAQRYYETLRPPDKLFAALRFLRLAIPRSACVSSPFGRRRRADGSSRSLLYRLLPIRLSSGNCQGRPSSRGTLLIIRHVPPTPVRPGRLSGPRVNCPARPPRLTKTRAHHKEISGLNHTAFDLADYASQGGSPLRHARLAAGCWSSSAGRDWLPAGFR